MDNKIISQVFTTTDYDQFKFIDNNRQADHVKALTVSFKERYVPNAILCNEKMEIIDGQNRFLAAKELGLPIYYYCIQGLGIYDVASLNSYGKNWNNRDFARMWAGLGKKAYITIVKFAEEFNELSFQTVLMLLSNSVAYQSQSIGSDSYVERNGFNQKNKFKLGLFEIKDIDFAYYVARCIMAYKPFVRPGVQIYKQNTFAVAMMQLLRNKNFDNAEMVRRAGFYPDMFFRCVNAKSYIEMLEGLWNFRRRNKVRFDY